MAIESLLNPRDDQNDQIRAHEYQPASSHSSQSQGSSSPESSNSHHTSKDPTLGRGYRRYSARQSAPSGERREFRPTYLQEEEYFIWYHRVDLGLDWTDVRQAYNEQFPQRQRRGFQGIQCKYYRCCETYGVPKVRARSRSAAAEKEYGMRARTGLWYSWMKPRS
ncbi:hypothetical protein MMC20_002091 [Loxospora ochrophaea]|nr:hypothetical protein [Loxospora ochrophaea]